MKEEDKKKFAILMRKLKVTFPSNLNDRDEVLRVEVYWEGFKNVSMELFEKGINEAMSLCKFFPKPVELSEFIWVIREREYLEKNPHEEYLKIDYVKTKEEIQNERETSKKCLNELHNKLFQKEVLNPTLEGERAKEFERKRLEAKEKLKQLN